MIVIASLIIFGAIATLAILAWGEHAAKQSDPTDPPVAARASPPARAATSSSAVVACCYLCFDEIRAGSFIVHPGHEYGDNAPVFCSAEHCDMWQRSLEAQTIVHAIAVRNLGRAIAQPFARLASRLASKAAR